MKRTITALLTFFSLSLAAIAQGAPGAQDFPGFGTVPDETAPELNAVYTADENEDYVLDGETLTSTSADESVILIKSGAKAKLLNSLINKASGDTSNDGQSNFYGLNAGIVTADGSTLTIQNVTVMTSANGSNAVFSTGEGSTIYVKNIKIHTTGDSSRGLDCTYGGTITAEKVEIVTEGAHCAAFATDRGEGTVTVNGGTARTSGEGSPVIYSTGAITVKNVTGSATGSEIAAIEGKNSITIENSTLSGASSQGVLIYQSMSGDAAMGTSTFTVKKSKLSSSTTGPFFYITNTNAVAVVDSTKISYNGDTLIRASGNNSERNWGTKGYNGATLDITITNSTLEGNVYSDSISRVNLNLGNKAKLTSTLNADNEGTVNLSLAKNATLTLTGDSYVNKFFNSDSKNKNIKSNGHNIYYNSSNSANAALGGKTYDLPGGGKLIGIAMEEKEIRAASSNGSTQDNAQGNGAPMGQPGGMGPQGGMGPNPGHGPKADMATITGTIKVSQAQSSITVTLLTDDGQEYTLEAAKGMGGAPGPDNKGKNGMGQNPPAGGKNMGEPKGDAPMAPPAQITLEELAALDGKTVMLKGFCAPNQALNTFIVMEYSEA